MTLILQSLEIGNNVGKLCVREKTNTVFYLLLFQYKIRYVVNIRSIKSKQIKSWTYL